MVNYREYEAS